MLSKTKSALGGKETKGSANPQVVTKILKELLK